MTREEEITNLELQRKVEEGPFRSDLTKSTLAILFRKTKRHALEFSQQTLRVVSI